MPKRLAKSALSTSRAGCREWGSTYTGLYPSVQAPAETLGELLQRYSGKLPNNAIDPDVMVGHLWYLIGCGDLTVSSTPDEALALLRERHRTRDSA